MADTNKPLGDISDLLLVVKEIRDAIRCASEPYAEDDEHIDTEMSAIVACARCARCTTCTRCFRCFRCEGCFRCSRCEGCFRCFRCG